MSAPQYLIFILAFNFVLLFFFCFLFYSYRISHTRPAHPQEGATVPKLDTFRWVNWANSPQACFHFERARANVLEVDTSVESPPHRSRAMLNACLENQITRLWNRNSHNTRFLTDDMMDRSARWGLGLFSLFVPQRHICNVFYDWMELFVWPSSAGLRLNKYSKREGNGSKYSTKATDSARIASHVQTVNGHGKRDRHRLRYLSHGTQGLRGRSNPLPNKRLQSLLSGSSKLWFALYTEVLYMDYSVNLVPANGCVVKISFGWMWKRWDCSRLQSDV